MLLKDYLSLYLSTHLIGTFSHSLSRHKNCPHSYTLYSKSLKSKQQKLEAYQIIYIKY